MSNPELWNLMSRVEILESRCEELERRLGLAIDSAHAHTTSTRSVYVPRELKPLQTPKMKKESSDDGENP